MTSSNVKTSKSRDAMQHERKPSIGGPGTQLPAVIESFLCWSLAISCLSVSGYHYLVATFVTPLWTQFQNFIQQTFGGGTTSASASNEHLVLFPCWLPLMTCSRGELASATPMERYQQLVQVLEAMGITPEQWKDEDLMVKHFRSNEICRRLASLAMRPSSTTVAAATAVQNSPHTLALGQELIRIWPRLLELPQEDEDDDSHHHHAFDITVIVPAFRERGVDVQTKLTYALQGASHPERIQVVLVDAGGCDDLSVVAANTPITTSSNGTTASSTATKTWGELVLVTFTGGGGRGPAQNFGAQHATGRFLTFCHSDTRLPVAWDAKVVQSLTRRRKDQVVANSCAFAFGIDTTPAGLNGGLFPPGIKAVETTANLRTHLYSLPYGDQCLSLPAVIFRYLGGFPDQCLMEDYELIGLLRKRAALGPKFWGSSKNNNRVRERLSIIGGPPALCSPRRWQTFGVLYVTFTNSKVVNLYAGGGSDHDIFHVYYGCPPPARSSERSPWEVELQQVLRQSNNVVTSR